MLFFISLADRFYKNYWNPTMATWTCTNCKLTETGAVGTYIDERVFKLKVVRATKSLSYPLKVDNPLDPLDKNMSITIPKPLSLVAIASAMFSASVSKYFMRTGLPQATIQAACLQMGQNAAMFAGNNVANPAEPLNTFNIPVFYNNFPFFINAGDTKQVEMTKAACGESKLHVCQNSVGVNTPHRYAFWQDCVINAYSKYWRKPEGLTTHSGYKRGERIQGIISYSKPMSDFRTILDAIDPKSKELVIQDVLKFKSVKQRESFRKHLDKYDSSVGTIAINAAVFMDLDIGQEAWPIVVACIMGAIALFVVMTMKCFPQLGAKMFGSCCGELFEGVPMKPKATAQEIPAVPMKETAEE